MKKAKYLIFAVSTMFAMTANSAVQSVSGDVLKIRSHDSSLSGTDWFQIDVTSAGACRTVSGKAVFSITQDEQGARHLSILLAAKMAGKPVTVGFDDVTHNAYYCSVRYIDV